MEKLILNDGTELDGRILADGSGIFIFVYADGLSLAEGFALFSDPDKTSRIVAQDHGTENIYEGFTRITAINSEFGNCNLTMKRGE